MKEDWDAEYLASEYVRIRAGFSELTKTYEGEKKRIKAVLDKIEGMMLGFLQETKQDSAKTAQGTFYKQEEILPTGSDWEAFYNWVKENDAFDALERRIKKTFISQYMESHDGAIPPGVSVLREWVVRVRKGKGESSDE